MVAHLEAGDLFLWDDRTFHCNAPGAPGYGLATDTELQRAVRIRIHRIFRMFYSHANVYECTSILLDNILASPTQAAQPNFSFSIACHDLILTQCGGILVICEQAAMVCMPPKGWGAPSRAVSRITRQKALDGGARAHHIVSLIDSVR